jgi:hypothetical protein
MPSRLVALKPPKMNHQARDGRFRQVDYDHAAPFFHNPRGVLIHRVRALYRLTFHDYPSWWIVDYWCENGGRSDDVDSDLLFDPGEKLVCARCEANAVAHRQKTSSELAGRHICIGICRPVNVCPVHAQPHERESS